MTKERKRGDGRNEGKIKGKSSEERERRERRSKRKSSLGEE